jgi:hypothetical protein
LALKLQWWQMRLAKILGNRSRKKREFLPQNATATDDILAALMVMTNDLRLYSDLGLVGPSWQRRQTNWLLGPFRRFGSQSREQAITHQVMEGRATLHRARSIADVIPW